MLEEEIHDANVSGAKIEYPFRENKLSQGAHGHGVHGEKGRGNQLSQGAYGHGVRREKCRGNQLRQLSRRDPQRFSNWYREEGRYQGAHGREARQEKGHSSFLGQAKRAEILENYYIH